MSALWASRASVSETCRFFLVLSQLEYEWTDALLVCPVTVMMCETSNPTSSSVVMLVVQMERLVYTLLSWAALEISLMSIPRGFLPTGTLRNMLRDQEMHLAGCSLLMSFLNENTGQSGLLGSSYILAAKK